MPDVLYQSQKAIIKWNLQKQEKRAAYKEKQRQQTMKEWGGGTGTIWCCLFTSHENYAFFLINPFKMIQTE